MIEIKVTDTGVGIDKEKLKNIFQVFTKVMQDREMNKAGTGLGLSISKNLANVLGGDITVVSEKGKGSQFTLTIRNLDRESPNKMHSNIDNQLSEFS